MPTSDPKRPLDYATPRAEPPRRREWRFDHVYFGAALLVFAVALVLLVWIVNRYGYTMDDMPAEDPRWADQAKQERWLQFGCCGVPFLGAVGFLFLVKSFYRAEAEPYGRG